MSEHLSSDQSDRASTGEAFVTEKVSESHEQSELQDPFTQLTNRYLEQFKEDSEAFTFFEVILSWFGVKIRFGTQNDKLARDFGYALLFLLFLMFVVFVVWLSS